MLPLLAVGAVSMLSSGYTQSQTNKANRAQIAAQNKAIALNNIAVVKQTGLELASLIDTQVTLRRQASDAFKDASLAGRLGVGTARQQSAAMGIIGASAEAVAGDVQQSLANANASIEQSQELSQFNLKVQLASTAQQGVGRLGQSVLTPKMPNPFQVGMITGGLSAASAYISASYKFGATAPKATVTG